jgi:serine/threonine-protein kinase RsbW
VSDSAHLRIDVPAAVDSIDDVQEAFATWWDGLHFDDDLKRFSFETAVVEIATNIVEHTLGSDREAGRRFTLDLDARVSELVAIFVDNGMPADIDLSAVTMADADDESGRGLAIALATLDSLDYRHETGRNIWTLVCRR